MPGESLRCSFKPDRDFLQLPFYESLQTPDLTLVFVLPDFSFLDQLFSATKNQTTPDPQFSSRERDK